MSIIGCIGDIHEPFCHPMYRRFCYDTFLEHRVDRIHFTGDIVDNHAISFHETDPQGHGAGYEARKARRGVKGWVSDFPKATVTIGNHDELHYRKGRAGGLPDLFLKTYRQIWKTPRWTWDFEFVIDDILFEHGTGNSGKNAALNLAIEKRTKICIGHIHSWAGVQWHTNYKDAVFGVNVGCGIDPRAYAFAYGRTFRVRPTLACAVIKDGNPFVFRMPCGKGEKYHRSRAGKAA